MSRRVNMDSTEPLTVTVDSVCSFLVSRGQHRSADLVRHMSRSSQEHFTREQNWLAVERQLRERLAIYESPKPAYVDPGPTWTGD